MLEDRPRPPRVAVLLSTYNGADFIEAQLESLVAQEAVSLEVFARDDGSTDATPRILAKYASVWPALAEPLGGANLGPALSFLELLRRSPDGFDYYAFCDQDDVWAPGKLARASRLLNENAVGRPALYCSRVFCVDRDLRPLGPAPLSNDGRFEHILFENIAYGNTAVLNSAARDLVRSAMPGADVIMHDWWCALVVSAFGEIICDDWSSVWYRQHHKNTIGAADNYLSEIWRLMKLFWRAPRLFWPVHAQAAEFLRLYGDRLTPARRRLTQSLIASRRSFPARLRFALFGKIIRGRPLTAIGARILVILGLY
jgi:glycosyltransferase involved in cell wall biosynthesis